MQTINKILKDPARFVITLFILSAISAAFYFPKLSYESFFTDEILYEQTGNSYLKGTYEENLQHPFIGKYLAGIPARFVNDRDTFILRTPFVICGIISSLLVYIIIKKQYGNFWGLMGFFLFLGFPYLYKTNRQVLFEAPMHMFWLLFHYFFLSYLDSKRLKDAVLTGVFIGLALGTKFTSAILLIFTAGVLLAKVQRQFNKNEIKNIITMYFVSAAVFMLSYTGLIITRGLEGFVDLVRTIKDVFIGRNSEGKTHIVAGQLYQKSPWWFYLYYIYKEYTVFHYLLLLVSFVGVTVKKSFQVFYWGFFAFLVIILNQLLSLKNDRYISSVELPLIFLIISGLQNLVSYKIAKITAVTLVGLILISSVYKISIFEPTKYNALRIFLEKQTNNFTNGDRVYIFGSIRSGRWTFEDLPPDIVVNRKDDQIRCELPHFKYIVLDEIETLKIDKNVLRDYVMYNHDGFDKKDIPGIDVYVQKPEANLIFPATFGCAQNTQ